jgi:hypothetical protein
LLDELVVVIGGKVFSHANGPILFDQFTLEFGSGIVELQWQNGILPIDPLFPKPKRRVSRSSASEYQDFHFLSSFRTAGVPIGLQFVISFLLCGGFATLEKEI